MDRYAPHHRRWSLYPLLLLLFSLLGSLSHSAHANTGLVSGQVTLPEGVPAYDPYGSYNLGIEIYPWDSTQQRYFDYPMGGIPLAADGSYSIELPEGNYKVVPVDTSGMLHFAPAMQEVTVSAASGPVVANFSAAKLGISGQVTLPAGFPVIDPYGSYGLGIEIYPWDNAQQRYFDYPMGGTPLAADGSYYIELPEGNYKVVPVDTSGMLHFAPAIQEVTVSAATGPVVANFSAAKLGISGQVTLPAGFPVIDPYGSYGLGIEIYPWDSAQQRYLDYPMGGTPLAADGSYYIELPEGNYKVVPVDTSGMLHFTPALQEVTVSATTGPVVANFVAGQLGISGQLTLPAGFPYLDPNGNATFAVDIYPWDSVQQRYLDYPIGVPLAADGSFNIELPEGSYKVVPVDFSGLLHFAPAMQEVTVSAANGAAVANFVAAKLGISGQVTLPAGFPYLDPNGNSTLSVDIYPWDSVQQRYLDYPISAPLAADGSYYIELPEGAYKVVPVDFTGMLHFAPAMQEVTVNAANGPAQIEFNAVLNGISGQLSIDARDAGTVSFCTADGSCRFRVDLFPFDPLSNQYLSMPAESRSVGADGRYTLSAPHGTYKVAITDTWQEMAFSPREIAGLVLSPEQGSAIADFQAVRPRMSGQLTATDPSIAYCDSAILCRFAVEVFALDPATASYGSMPVAVSSIASDGRFETTLPPGSYRLVAIDSQGVMEFAPAEINGVVLGADQAEVSGLNFVASTPVPALSIQSLTLSAAASKRGWNAVAEVIVVDPDGNPLPGAEVYGYWGGLVDGESMATTSDRRRYLGVATLKSPRTQASGTISFTVTDIVHPLYPYNPKLDQASQGEITN